MRIPGRKNILRVVRRLQVVNHHGIDGMRRFSQMAPQDELIHRDWQGGYEGQPKTPLETAMEEANKEIKNS